MSNKPPCKFFQSGNCRNGSRCPFPHVYENKGSSWNNSNAFGSSNKNTPRDDLERFWSDKSLSTREKELKDAINSYNEIESQPLTSSFGFGQPAMGNLINGRDYSFEESRWDFYQSQQNNQVPEYERKLQARKNDMKDCLNYLNQNITKAARYSQLVTKAFHEKTNTNPKPFIPNELNLDSAPAANTSFGSSSFGTTSNTSNAFGNSSTASNPFGNQTSVFGNSVSQSANPFATTTTTTNPSPFGSSSLAQPQSTSGFGTTGFGSGIDTSFGQITLGSNTSTASAFGSAGFAATNTANSNKSAFGTSGFGSTLVGSTFGSLGSSAFGAANSASTTGNSVFGNTGFGTTSTGTPTANNTSPFGSLNKQNDTAKTTPALSFGQTATSSAFGTTGFGSTKPAGSTPVFGQNTATANSSPFGAQAKPSGSVFEQTGSTGTSPFANNLSSSQNVFGQGGSAASPFGQSTTSVPTFGNIQPANTSENVFGQNSNPIMNTSFGSGSFGGFGANPAENFKVPFTQSGKQQTETNDDELDEQVKDQFSAAKFTLGLVPDIPPPLKYC